ncbi:MAG: protein kinase [Myxococcales bacterium]|nr:protein kinase [Myxococcales bacterium]
MSIRDRIDSATPVDTLGIGRLGSVELGGFRLLHVLGEGSFGTAYLADQLGTDRKAVVKIAHPMLMDGEVGAIVRGRFEAEVRAVSRLQHPSLVTLYAAGTTSDGLPALATEYVPGRTLATLIRDGIDRQTIQTVFLQIGAGLVALHESGIVHRDLSPDNVMVAQTPAGVVAKIIDLGVAKIDERGWTGPNPIGTPRYMAPEQINGAAEQASDLYALGALLYFALTGHEYLHDVGGPVDVLLRSIALESALSPCRLEPAVSPAEDELVRSLLSPDPRARPSAVEFVDRWSSMTRESAGRPRALLVTGDAEIDETVLFHLAKRGFEVVTTHDPGQAVRAGPSDFALIVLPAAIPGYDTIALVRQVEGSSGQTELWIVGRRFSVAFGSLTRARCLVVPDDLEPAFEAASISSGRPPPPTAPPVAELAPRVEAFIGGGTELVTLLGEASDVRDDRQLVVLGDQLARLAEMVGASQVTSLSRTLVALVQANELEAPAPFVLEVQAAFLAAVRKLLNPRPDRTKENS